MICFVPKTMSDGKLRVPLSFRIPLQELQEIEEAVQKETRKHRTDLVEFIWNWAWNEYKKSGSLQALLSGTRTGRYSRRVSEELQDQLYTALATILDRAPSTVIEDVVRVLTARAGKYGTPK
jgi:Txe/YoeB family toxin of Txe-Axe toxin-antitoxin module